MTTDKNNNIIQQITVKPKVKETLTKLQITPKLNFLTIAMEGAPIANYCPPMEYMHKFIDLSVYPRNLTPGRSSDLKGILLTNEKGYGFVKPITFYMEKPSKSISNYRTLNSSPNKIPNKTTTNFFENSTIEGKRKSLGKSARLRAHLVRKKPQENSNASEQNLSWNGIINNIRNSLEAHLQYKFRRNLGNSIIARHTKNTKSLQIDNKNPEKYVKTINPYKRTFTRFKQSKKIPIISMKTNDIITKQKYSFNIPKTVKLANRYYRNTENVGNAKYAATIFSNAKLSKTLAQFCEKSEN